MKSVIAEKYGVKPNTLSTWIKNKESIKQSYEGCEFSPKRKKRRTGNKLDLEKAVLRWIHNARSAGMF